MTSFKTLDDLGELNGKRVLVRVDINVPMDDGRVTDLTRIERIMPTIADLSQRGARIGLLAHFGRPKGKADPDQSLGHVRAALEKCLGQSVGFCNSSVGEQAEAAMNGLKPGGILLLENTRFDPGEEANDPDFARALARLGDIFVNDAFSAAHRAHASTEGIAHLLPAYAGRTMQAELEALQQALGNPQHPVIAIVGGAKVSTKLELLLNLVSRVDHLVIGGGMANTFLAALGLGVGKSLCEHELTDKAQAVIARANHENCEIILPSDVVVATEFKANADHSIVPVDAVPADTMILDAGPQTIDLVGERIRDCRTLVWNGPMGAFELEPFDRATVVCAQEAARATQRGRLVSIAGGGDTVSALNQAGVADDFTYVSTAGGAFLEWMEGKELPGVAALRQE